MMHEHIQKLAIAVEGKNTSDDNDLRIGLFRDLLQVDRMADQELETLHLAIRRVLLTLQRANGHTPAIPQGMFEREYEALNTNITSLRWQRNELEPLCEIARTLNS